MKNAGLYRLIADTNSQNTAHGHKTNMTSVLYKLRTAWHLPFHEKFWFIFLYPYSGLIRASILLLPYRFLSRCYGQYYKNYQLSPLVSEKQLNRAWRIGKTAELAAKYTPWESKCLVQAIMVRTVLGIYRIPYALYLGARLTKDPEEPMKAHAWIKVGARVVSGREGHQAYAITACFISKSILHQATQPTKNKDDSQT